MLKPRGCEQSSWICCGQTHNDFLARKAMCWEAQTKKGFSMYTLQKGLIVCHTRVFSATLAYRDNHSVNSILLDYTGQQWQISGPFKLEDSIGNDWMSYFLLSTELLKLFMIQWLVLDHPPLLAASLWHVVKKGRLLSAETCPTLPERQLELEFPDVSSRPLTLLTSPL